MLATACLTQRALIRGVRERRSPAIHQRTSRGEVDPTGNQPPQRTVIMNLFRIFAAGCTMLATVAAAEAQSIDWAKVDGIFGRKAAVGGTVHRYGFPRSDLQVTLDGVTIRPTLALGGWVAFQPMRDTAMVMGDLVLLQTEVNPVMAKLIEGGVDVTAVHNHLLRAE